MKTLKLYTNFLLFPEEKQINNFFDIIQPVTFLRISSSERHVLNVVSCVARVFRGVVANMLLGPCLQRCSG